MAKAKKKKDNGPKVVSTHQFSATIMKTEEGPKLAIKSPRFYLHELKKFKDGEQVSVIITSRRPKRSEQQNRFYWGAYLPAISAETGEQNLDRLHELFKGKFLTTGIYEVLGNKVRIKKSTTELSVGEFCQYIMAIEHETGIQAPPTESFGLDSLKDGIKKLNEK